MKQFFTLSIMMLFALTSFAEDYNVTIAGITVTSDNCDNITGTGISGQVSYDADTHTLTLKDATIETASDYAIYFADQYYDLTVAVSGECSIKSARFAICFCGRKTNYISPAKYGGKLIANGGKAGIYTQGHLVVSENVNVDAEGGEYGFYDLWSEFKITFNCSKGQTIFAKGGTAAVKGWGEAEINNGVIIQPESCAYNTTERTFTAPGGTDPIKEVTIVGIVTYPVKIQGIQVTSLNQYDILGDDTALLIDGGSYYLLGLSGATIETYNGSCGVLIENECDRPFYISTVGLPSRIITSGAPIRCDANIDLGIYAENLENAWEINCTSGANPAINMQAGNLFIERASGFIGSRANNSTYAIYCHTGKITFRNSNLELASSEKVIYCNEEPGYENCYILSPEWHEFSTADKIYYTGPYLTNYLNIRPGLGLIVGGKDVTEQNKEDIFGDGKASYDPMYHLLSLDNVNITDEGYAIKVFGSDLSVDLKGENTIVSTDQDGFVTGECQPCNVAIHGKSTDDILNISGASLGIYHFTGNLFIYDCAVNAVGPAGGIVGEEKDTFHDGASITIQNARVTAECSNYGAFGCFNSITLDNVYLAEPTNAVLGNNWVFGTDGEPYVGRVVFDIIPSGIEEVSANANANARKFLQKGGVVIVKNGNTYNALGQEIK